MPKITQVIHSQAPEAGFELSDKQLAAIKTTSQLILAVVAIAGAITLSAALPGLFKGLNKLYWANKRFGGGGGKARVQKQELAIRQSLYYLKSRNYIELIPQGGDFLVVFKEKGRKAKKKLNYEWLAIKKADKWDGKWWVVIADIPKKLKSHADMFRRKLLQMDFYPLQRTVWFHPYDPREEIDFISAYWRIDRFVTVMEVNKISEDDQKKLVNHFRRQALI